MLEIARSVVTRLVAGGNNAHPVWMTGGNRILFVTSRGPKAGTTSLVSQAIDGEAGSMPLEVRGGGYPQGWTPGDRALLLTKVAGRGLMFWSRDDEKAYDLPHTEHTRFGRLSPDGRWVAYESNETGRDEVYVQTFPNPAARSRVSAAGVPAAGVGRQWSGPVLRRGHGHADHHRLVSSRNVRIVPGGAIVRRQRICARGRVVRRGARWTLFDDQSRPAHGNATESRSELVCRACRNGESLRPDKTPAPRSAEQCMAHVECGKPREVAISGPQFADPVSDAQSGDARSVGGAIDHGIRPRRVRSRRRLEPFLDRSEWSGRAAER